MEFKLKKCSFLRKFNVRKLKHIDRWLPLKVLFPVQHSVQTLVYIFAVMHMSDCGCCAKYFLFIYSTLRCLIHANIVYAKS